MMIKGKKLFCSCVRSDCVLKGVGVAAGAKLYPFSATTLVGLRGQYHAVVVIIGDFHIKLIIYINSAPTAQ